MWAIEWLPEAFRLLTAEKLIPLGLFVWLFSKFLSSINLKWYAFPLEILGITILIGAAFLYAGIITENKWKNRAESVKEIVVEIIKEVPVINTKIETKVVEKIEFITINTEIIRTEIQKEKEIINSSCEIKPATIDLYNRSLMDPLRIKENHQ